MKAPLKPRRPSPAEALAIATSTAPQQPPVQIAEATIDGSTTLNLRVKASTIKALMDAAKAQGLTMKQVVCQALDRAGLPIAPADLEDRTPRRRKRPDRVV